MSAGESDPAGDGAAVDQGPAASLGEAPLRSILARLWSSEAVALCAGLVQSVIVARSLGASALGQGALVLAYPALVFAVINPQSEEAVVQFVSTYRERNCERAARDVVGLAYRLDVALLIVGVLATVLTTSVAVDHLGVATELRWLLLVSAIAAGCGALSMTGRAVLSSVGDFRTIGRATIALALSRPAVVIGAVLLFEVEGLIIGSALVSLGEAALWTFKAYARVRRDLAGHGRPADRNQRREFVTFLVFTDLTTLASVLVKHLDILVLGGVRSDADVGVYRFAKTVISPMARVVRPLQEVSYPRLSALAVRGTTEIRAEIRRLTQRISAPLAGLLAVGGVGVVMVLPLVAGSSYEGVVPVATVLFAGSAMSVSLFWVRPAMLALRQERRLFAITLVSAIATVVGYLSMASPYGPVGIAAARSAIAGVAGTVVAGAVVIVCLRKETLKSNEGLPV